MSPSLSRVQSIPAPVLRELTGITTDQLARLIEEVGPVWEAERAERLARPDRQRAPGAGRKHTLSFTARLVMVLMYLRWNISYRALGGLFGVSKDGVLRAMDELLELLADHGITAPDGARRIGSESDLLAELAQLSDEQRAALVDGTFVPTGRPGGGWEHQRELYNPRKHRHAHNFQAICDDRGRLLYVGGTTGGSTHDLTALAGSTAAGPLADSGVCVIGDKAYQGIAGRLDLAEAFTPKRRRRRGEPDPSPAISEIESELNVELARQRVRVEHSIRRLKIRRILHSYRLAAERFTDTIEACAALATLPT
jgi:hypothetical protein